MRDRLMAETKAALKAQDKARLSALRLISAALQQADIASRSTLPDQDIPAVLQKMIKQRRESLAIYEKAGRTEQAAQEAGEIAVIEEFLPKQMSDAEARDAIAAVVKDVGATSPKEMGKVMAALKERYAGRMDFGKASALVKEQLNPAKG
ncbi:MAG: GatB/YqeY domain-containing protein [Hyphomicrobiaceae bacterium]